MCSPSKRKTSSPVSDQPGVKRFVCNLPSISESGRDLDNDDFEENLGIPDPISDSSDNKNIGVNENPRQVQDALPLGRQQARQQQGRGVRGRRQQGRRQAGQGRRTAPKNDERKKWTKVESPDDFVPKNIPFIDNEGLKVRIKNDAGPMDFFNLYITPEIIELHVIETNRYAQKYIALKGDTIKGWVYTS